MVGAAARVVATPGGTSALAALRAKKEGLPSDRPSTAVAQPSKPRSTAPATASWTSPKRPALKERSRNAQTPAPTRRNVAATTEQRPIGSKLASRKHGMFAQTPKAAQVQTKQAMSKRAGADYEEDKADADVSNVSKTAPITRKIAPSTTVRPSKASNLGHSKVTRKGTYEMSESPEPVKTSKRPKAAAVKPTASKPASKTVKTKDLDEDERTEAKPKGRPRRSAKLPNSSDEYDPEPKKTRKLPDRKVNPAPESPDARAAKTVKGKSKTAITSDVDTSAAQDEAEAADEVDDRNEDTVEDGVLDLADDATRTHSKEVLPSVAPHSEAPKAKGDSTLLSRSELAAGSCRQPGAAKGSKHANNREGASQDNAIVLSDRPEPSSSPPSTPAAATTAPTTLATVQQPDIGRQTRPYTPAGFQSSPPVDQWAEHQRPAAGPRAAEETRRTTIIGFDRSGPLNQGTRSAKKSAVGPARTGRSSLPPRKVPLAPEGSSARGRLAARRDNGPSSGATSMKSYRTDRMAPPKNVAESVGDALAGFLGRPARMAPTPTPFKNALKAPSRAEGRMAQSQPARAIEQDNDHGWTNIGDLEGDTIIVTETDAPVKPMREETVATLAVTAKPGAAKPVSKPPVGRTASQIVMPPPGPRVANADKRRGAPTDPNMRSSDRANGALAESTAAEERTAKARAKRPREIDDLETQHAAKKFKRSSRNEIDPSAPTSYATADPQSKDSLRDRRPAPAPEPSKRMSRKSKATRQASQGVDMHGSPIPKDMVVAENATTLETYSQQAQLSSEEAVPDSILEARRVAAEPGKKDATFFEDLLAAPSHQLKILSSNEKRQPASPREDSQAITGIVLGRVDTKQLIINQAAAPPTDPFTSSEDLPKQPPKKGFAALFDEQLRAVESERITRKRDRTGTAEDDDQEKTLVAPEPEPQPKRSKGTSGRPQPRAREPEQAARKRDQEEHSGDEDPDKTLVEPEPEPQPKASKGAADRQSRYARSYTKMSEDRAPDMPAIGKWRTAIQPHQMNLFDELVAVSHKLVRHLVDQETAMKEAVNDYKKCSINAIEQLELQQAQEYRQSLKKLEQKKRAMQVDLDGRRADIQKAMDATRRKQNERSKNVSTVSEEEARLKGMVEEL